MGFIEQLKRHNEDYRTVRDAEDTYKTLAKLFGLDQQQAPPGILGPSDAERDAFVNQMAPGGQATPQTMQAVQAAREAARAQPMGSPGWRPPDPATMPQQPQKPPLPPNTDMMLRALQSQDPRVIKAAMNQMPEELFPTQATSGEDKPFNNWVAPVSDPSRDPALWEENVLTRTDGSIIPTGQFRRRNPQQGTNVTLNMGDQVELAQEWRKANERAAKAGELYNRISGLDLGAGGTEVAANALRKLFGTNSTEDIWRKELANVLNTQILGLLPPGPASDKDILFASKGVEWAFSNPKALAYALKGAEKLAKAEAKFNEFLMSNKDDISRAMQQFQEWAVSQDNGVFEPTSPEKLAELEAEIAKQTGGKTPAGGNTGGGGNRRRFARDESGNIVEIPQTGGSF